LEALAQAREVANCHAYDNEAFSHG
jgi:hypothetical protein